MTTSTVLCTQEIFQKHNKQTADFNQSHCGHVTNDIHHCLWFSRMFFYSSCACFSQFICIIFTLLKKNKAIPSALIIVRFLLMFSPEKCSQIHIYVLGSKWSCIGCTLIFGNRTKAGSHVKGLIIQIVRQRNRNLFDSNAHACHHILLTDSILFAAHKREQTKTKNVVFLVVFNCSIWFENSR